MALKRVDTKGLDIILDNMIDTVDNSKSEIFQIGEQCREFTNSIHKELQKINEMLISIKDEEVILEEKVQNARLRLSEVSKYFELYSEEEVREAYEHAHSLQMKLTMSRQLEKQLLERKLDLEMHLSRLQETIDKSENLVSQTSVVFNYLTSELKDIPEFLEDAKEKQEFGLRIIEVQEEERKRLSREIHDGPAQMLANVLMRSNMIEKIYQERGIDEALKEVQQFKRTLRDALYEVRHIIYDLRPMALDDIGLVPTLKKYLSTIEEYNQITRINFEYLGEDFRLASNMEVALFRLVQESVQNALKHAKAQLIQVKLEINKKYVHTIIRDNGVGFDLNERKEKSFGLIGMRERVELLDGSLTIHSKKGEGTTITIFIPLPT